MRINPCCGSNTSILFQIWDALQYYSKLPMWNTPRWPVIFPMLFRGYLWKTRAGEPQTQPAATTCLALCCCLDQENWAVWVSSLVLVTRHWQNKTLNTKQSSWLVEVLILLKFFNRPLLSSPISTPQWPLPSPSHQSDSGGSTISTSKSIRIEYPCCWNISWYLIKTSDISWHVLKKSFVLPSGKLIYGNPTMKVNHVWTENNHWWVG